MNTINTIKKGQKLKNQLVFVFLSLIKTNQSVCGNSSTIVPILITCLNKKLSPMILSTFNIQRTKDSLPLLWLTKNIILKRRNKNLVKGRVTNVSGNWFPKKSMNLVPKHANFSGPGILLQDKF